MPDRPNRPTADLEAVETAMALLLDATDGLTDEQARGASRLPGWTRGHVLTHIARNADAFAFAIDGAVRGEEVHMYPGGDEQRTRDIEAGAGRPVDELRADLAASQRHLDDAWARVEGDTWDREFRPIVGKRTVEGSIAVRRREILVHLVDLAFGVAPGDLPADYLERDGEYLRANRTRETWPDAPW
ncbi:MAG TPA: maleylpyruvate isomerase N-terminal domain-containing protein [Acidimicrobiia bacterium]